MRASSAEIGEIARRAGVRITVAFHAWAYRKELKGKASAEGYAVFTELPLEVARRVFAVLDSIPAPTPKAKRERIAARPVPDELPEDWIILGRDKRMWPMDVCRTEAERFVNYFKMTGKQYADWRACWLGWIDRSHRENGTALEGPQKDWSDPAVQREQLVSTIALYRRMGRNHEADEMERSL